MVTFETVVSGMLDALAVSASTVPAEAGAAAPNWTLELLKIAQGLLGTLLGGALVLLGGWLSDRRKNQNDDLLRDQREGALLTGMFAVRNFIMECINDFSEDLLWHKLETLKTAQAYVHRLIDKAPGESESLMITVVEIGLQLDALISTFDHNPKKMTAENQAIFVGMLAKRIAAVESSLEQFDIIATGKLPMMTEEELAQFPGFETIRDDTTTRSIPRG